MGVDRDDLTFKAVAKQLHAMGCHEYEVGIYHRYDDRMTIRSWAPTTVIQSLKWLRYQNFNGHDIYIRGKGSTGLILIDDLSTSAVTRLTDAGLVPACVVETSPLNFQVWIRVAYDLNPEVATQVAKLLARDFGGDPASADWRHFGRLAGFTNRKPEHVEESGRRPFVLVHSYTANKISPLADQLLVKAEALAKELEIKNEKLFTSSRFDASSNLLPNDFYKKELSKLSDRFNPLDESIADWKIVCRMLTAGYSAEQIFDSVIAESPNLHSRKLRHVTDYVERTINKASKLYNLKRDKKQGEKAGVHY